MKFIIFILILFYPLNILASSKQLIKNKLEETNNISFKFIQKIGKKTEQGKCIISYSKKILCKYDDIYNKILVSNGKTLLIKNKNSSFANTYKTENTYFKYFLNKEFLITKIEGNIIEQDQKFLLSINDQSNQLNIFFDKKNYEIKGWTTTDIYQNRVETNLFNIEVNMMIDEKLFRIQKYIN